MLYPGTPILPERVRGCGAFVIGLYIIRALCVCRVSSAAGSVGRSVRSEPPRTYPLGPRLVGVPRRGPSRRESSTGGSAVVVGKGRAGWSPRVSEIRVTRIRIGAIEGAVVGSRSPDRRNGWASRPGPPVVLLCGSCVSRPSMVGRCKDRRRSDVSSPVPSFSRFRLLRPERFP